MAAMLVVASVPRALGAQAAPPAPPVQDSTLNNLVHTPGYRTAPLGTLGQVVRLGSGPVDVVLIPGWGFSAEDFAPFIADLAARYRVVAVTLAGFGGTAAPPMPDSGTSYGEQTWTRAAEEAIARLIASEGLRRPIVVGHFVVGGQLALRLAIDHPDLVGGVVVVGGSPAGPSRPGRPRSTLEERVQGVDQFLAPRWYRTVTPQTWNRGNYPPGVYSANPERARQLWQRSADVPIPVMVRYISEYFASDITRDFARLGVPTRILTPGFTAALLGDTSLAWVKTFFQDDWAGAPSANPLIELRRVADAAVFITHDQPAAVLDVLDEVARLPR